MYGAIVVSCTVYEIYMDYIGCEPFRELSHYIAVYEVYVSLAILE